MRLTVIPNVVGELRTVAQYLLREFEELQFGGLGETIQTTAFLRLTRIMRRVLGT